MTLKFSLQSSQNDTEKQFLIAHAFVQQYVNEAEMLVTEEDIFNLIETLLRKGIDLDLKKTMKEILLEGMNIINCAAQTQRRDGEAKSERTRGSRRGKRHASNSVEIPKDHSVKYQQSEIPKLTSNAKELGSVLGRFLESNMAAIIPSLPAGLSSPKEGIKESTLVQKNKLLLEHVMMKRVKGKFDLYNIMKDDM